MRVLGYGLAVAAALIMTTNASAAYITLSVPGAQSTHAFGIDGSNVVGLYYDGAGNARGFVYDGTSYTPLNAPGALYTYAFGIDGSNIVGYYYDGTATRGFVYDSTSSSYTSLNVPGANYTLAHAIDGGNIVGYYNAGTGTQGFVYDGTMYTSLNVPGASHTYAYGIDGSNIVGMYLDGAGKSYGFLYTPDSPPTSAVPAPPSAVLSLIGMGTVLGGVRLRRRFA